MLSDGLRFAFSLLQSSGLVFCSHLTLVVVSTLGSAFEPTVAWTSSLTLLSCCSIRTEKLISLVVPVFPCLAAGPSSMSGTVRSPWFPIFFKRGCVKREGNSVSITWIKIHQLNAFLRSCKSLRKIPLSRTLELNWFHRNPFHNIIYCITFKYTYIWIIFK